MEYQFIRQEPCREKVIFVLTLDRKKLKERVLIGTEDEVRSRLEGNEGAELACDTTNPLGTLLIRFDKTGRQLEPAGPGPAAGRDAHQPMGTASVGTGRREIPLREIPIRGTDLPVHRIPYLECVSESP